MAERSKPAGSRVPGIEADGGAYHPQISTLPLEPLRPVHLAGRAHIDQGQQQVGHGNRRCGYRRLPIRLIRVGKERDERER